MTAFPNAGSEKAFREQFSDLHVGPADHTANSFGAPRKRRFGFG
jgi:hypothetical protein